MALTRADVDQAFTALQQTQLAAGITQTVTNGAGDTLTLTAHDLRCDRFFDANIWSLSYRPHNPAFAVSYQPDWLAPYANLDYEADTIGLSYRAARDTLLGLIATSSPATNPRAVTGEALNVTGGTLTP